MIKPFSSSLGRWLCMLAWALLALHVLPVHATSLRIGVSHIPPFQYKNEQQRYTGLDVEMVTQLCQKLKWDVQWVELPWSAQLQALKTGQLDGMMGALRTEERTAFALFSKPTRRQSEGFYVRTQDPPQDLHTAQDVQRAVREGRFTLGAVQGYAYTHPMMLSLLRDPPSHLVLFPNDFALLEAIQNKTIDGYWADQLHSSSLLWRLDLRAQISALPLASPASKPVHLMFSRQTISPDTIQHVNQAIETLTSSHAYNALVRHTVLPVFTEITTHTFWFYLLQMLGIIAFTIPGLIIARTESYNVLGALVLGLLPGIGGGILRDVLVDRHPVFVIQTPSYLYAGIGTWLLFWILMHTFKSFQRDAAHGFSRPFVLGGSVWVLGRGLVALCDGLGYASFTVVGVMVALEKGLEPLWLWGPLLAVLTSSGGGIVRDMIRKRSDIAHLTRNLEPLITACWGSVLSWFLIWETNRLIEHEVLWAVMGTLCGVLCTLWFCFWHHIHSPPYQ